MLEIQRFLIADITPREQSSIVTLPEHWDYTQTPIQWRSQPKLFWGARCWTLGEQLYVVWDVAAFSKHKMTRYAKNSGWYGSFSLATPTQPLPITKCMQGGRVLIYRRI